MKRLFSHPELSTEMVAYQPDSKLFRQLTIACAAIMDQSPKEQDQALVQNQKTFADIINTYIGSTATFVLSDEYPCMRIFDEYHNGVLIRNDNRQWVAEYGSFVRKFIAAGPRRGKVDIAQAKVSGLFSELPWTIYMPYHWFTHKINADGFKLSAEEIASIIIHEIGHFFTYCEAFFRTVTSNLVLSDMSRALADSGDVSVRELIIGRTATDLGLKDINVSALAVADNQLVETAMVYETIELSRTELGVDIYDTTSSEALADQFVSRMGASRYMVTAMHKFLNVAGEGDAYTPMPVFMFYQMLSIAGMFVSGAVNPILPFLFVGYNVLNITCGGFNDYGDGTYDTPKKRFERVRNDSVNRLKNRNISAAERSRTLDDIHAIEKILKDVAERNTWQTWVATTFIPKYRRARKSMALQQELEALANNPLYVSAAKLASLST